MRRPWPTRWLSRHGPKEMETGVYQHRISDYASDVLAPLIGWSPGQMYGWPVPQTGPGPNPGLDESSPCLYIIIPYLFLGPSCQKVYFLREYQLKSSVNFSILNMCATCLAYRILPDLIALIMCLWKTADHQALHAQFPPVSRGTHLLTALSQIPSIYSKFLAKWNLLGEKVGKGPSAGYEVATCFMVLDVCEKYQSQIQYIGSVLVLAIAYIYNTFLHSTHQHTSQGHDAFGSNTSA
jgi:hypothetical protein